MASVRLINCFQVPADRDADFLTRFRAVNAYMSAKPGYRGHRLHRSLAPDARYRFVNYVEWESAEHLATARDERFAELSQAVLRVGVTSTHSLYEIVDARDAD